MQGRVFSCVLVVCICATALGVPMPVADDDKPNYRLKTNFKPKNYKVDITIAKIDAETFSGKVTILIDKPADNNTDLTLTMHRANCITLTKVECDASGPSVPIDLSTIKYDEITKIQEITFEQNPTKAFNLIFTYTGKIYDSKSLYGIYRSEIKKNEYILTTQFQPSYARRAFPCFDEPSFKATFDISLTVPTGYTAMSNQPILPPTPPPTAPARVDPKFNFKPTKEMSTYLVAFVVYKDLAKTPLEDPNVDPTMTIWSPPGTATNAVYAKSVSRLIYDALKTALLVDMKDYIEHLDQIAIPDFAAGAMENWGLVTYRETALLCDNDKSPLKDKERIARVIAHEFAHNWFGNLVTLNWWKDTWLNEGFATYFETHGINEIKDVQRFEIEKQFVVDELYKTMETDGNNGAHPLSSEVNTIDEIQAHFGTISYDKGASIIRMMSNIVGDKAKFMEKLQIYIDTNKLQNVEPKTLFDVFEEVDGHDMSVLMDNWITKSGYPVVHASIVEADGKKQIAVTQEQFFYKKPDGKAEAEATEWFVPIVVESHKYPKATTTSTTTTTTTSTAAPTALKATELELALIDEHKDAAVFSYSTDASTITWLKPDVKDPLPLPNTVEVNTAYILNGNNFGYYRVNYETDLWDRIITVLSTDHTKIDQMVRAQLIDDIMNLARAGYTDYNKAFELTTYLMTEVDYYPWKSATNAFAYLRKRLAGEALGDDIANNLKTWMQNFYTKYANFTKPAEEEKPIDQYARLMALEWGCDLGIGECQESAKEHFANLLKPKADDELDIHARSVVYCSGLRQTTTEEAKTTWDKVFEKYSEATLASEKVMLLNVMGCIKDKDVLKNYLEKSVNGAIRSQDASTVFKAVLAGNPESTDIALEFLNTEGNFDRIVNNYGSMNAMTSVITQVADRITNNDQLEQLEKFVADNKENLQDASVAAENAIETAKSNMAWTTDYKNTFNKDGPNGATGMAGASLLGLLTVALFAMFA